MARLLPEHEVDTVPQLGWSGLSNGELLRRASGEFDVLVTGDQSLQHQQNLADLELDLVVVAAPNNHVETISGLAPRIAEAIQTVPFGPVQVVAA